jgi:glycosyltransferase involved in cell wall biosynthesis
VKILWSSNAPWACTGYANQTKLFVPLLAELGHDIAIHANYGLAGGIMEWEDHRVYPSGYDAYGNDVIGGHALHWFRGEPGLVITLYDAWVFKPGWTKELPQVACWAPVDHSPCPPKVKTFFEDAHATPIAYSRFGEQSFKAAGFDPLYVPHGVDTTVFTPRDREASRKAVGLPQDRFIVGMVSTNKGRTPSRKAFDAAFRAFSALAHEHPDALLYVHSDMRGSNDGLELDILAAHYKIDPENLIFCDGYAYRAGMISDDQMAQLYSSFDVLSFATMGEGFGLPALEAQACGCPVIVTDFSAQSELCGSGWRVPFQLAYDGFQAADLVVPLDGHLIEAHLRAYDSARDDGWASEAVKFAANYDAKLVTEKYWAPVLATLEGRMPTNEPIVL